MAKKKPNPHKIPATMADVQKARWEGMDFATSATTAIIFTALTDKMGMDVNFLQDLWGHVEYVSESVSLGYVTIPQMKRTLKEESGIEIK